MNRFTCMLFLLLAIPASATERISAATAHQIDYDVATVLARTETPGATILVLQDGQRIYSHAYGHRDLERRRPAAMDTHYEIGSITKQFTAAAILQLQEAGKLNIDTKVSAYLPQVPHANEITLRQLLTHTSGMPDYLDFISDKETTKPTTFLRLMDLIGDKPLDFPPGGKASYSNTGYMILGRIIEVTSHESYRHYIRAHLLQVAGMTQTFTVLDEPTLSTMAVGYRRVNGRLTRGLTIHDSYSGSAGDLVSTVSDVEKWNEALMSGKIVRSADYALMTTPQMSSGGENTGYGFGLFIDTVNDQPRIGHTGGTFGFTCANFYFPEQKLRIIAFTNNVDHPEPGEVLTNAIFTDLYPDFARAAREPKPGEDPTVTARAKAAFENLQEGSGDASLFGASLNAKLIAGVAAHMAGIYGSYGASTSYVFKGRRLDNGKSWSDYRIEFGPGSALKFSIALDAEGKVVSLGFDGF